MTADLMVAELEREVTRTPAPQSGKPYAVGGPTVFDANGKPTIAKVRYTHDAMVDLIIKDPWISQNQMAAYFGYSPAWISVVISSDAFQERLAARKDELIDPVIRATVEERFRALIIRSTEILQEKLSLPVHQVDAGLALKTLDTAARAMGYGARDRSAGGVNVQFVVNVPEKAASSQEWAASRGRTIEHETAGEHAQSKADPGPSAPGVDSPAVVRGLLGGT
jgi:hypothetical protein